jgi:hypothetical protein
MPTPKKKKSFIDVMCEIRDLERKEVVEELSMATDMNNGIRCPVPDCDCMTVFKRWGDMRGHFLDDSTHKKDYFRAFLDRMHEPFCDSSGPGFNHGVNSLMLALIRQPTSVDDLLGEKSSSKKGAVKVIEPVSVPSARPKKTRPVQEQQELLPSVPTPSTSLPEPTTTLFEQVAAEATQRRSGKSAFSQISEYIRDSDEINKTWRGKVLEEYVDMFHGMPPCFHCRSEEGKQIHHQNPLFHEIVLISLNKLGTTADRVIEERDKGNEEPLKSVLHDVFAYHMKPGRVCAVPYCQGCNQDAEIKRKKGKRT